MASRATKKQPTAGTEGVIAEDAATPEDTAERYDKRGRLTLAGMRAVIAEGGSVGYNGKTITSADGLPSEAELAEGDEAAEAAALENLERAQAAIDAQRARLLKGKGAKKADDGK
jgi:hypothetical protein